MEDETQREDDIKIGLILKEAAVLCKTNFFLFIAITLLGFSAFLLKTVLSVIPQLVHPWILSGLSLTGIFTYQWSVIALIIAVSHRYVGRKTTFRECLTQTKGRYWRVVGVEVQCFLIFVVGLLLLVVPGIYWGTLFSLAALAAVLETRRDINPLRMSTELVKESFWKVFLVGLIMLALGSSLEFVTFGLSKISQNLETITHEIFTIFYFPFSGAVGTVLYLRLKEKKQGELALRKEEMVHTRGKSWLGCLGALGLVVAIVVLIAWWSVVALRLFQTEKGSQFSDYLKKAFSSEISFPGGVHLARPKGWFVVKRENSPLAYELSNLKNEEIKKLGLRAIPLRDLGFLGESISLNDPSIGVKLFEQIKTKRKSGWLKSLYESFKAQGTLPIPLKNRDWIEFTLKSVEEDLDSPTRTSIWKHVYTIFEDNLLVASYSYSYTEAEPENLTKLEESRRKQLRDRLKRTKEALQKEEKEIREILGSISFREESE